MKTVAKRILTLIVVFCMACVGLVCTPITGAKAANVDYVETEFGAGKLLITTTYNGKTYYLPAATTSSAPAAKEFTNVSEISEDNLWTVTADGTNYVITNSEGKYLYATDTNNGIRVGTTTCGWTYGTDNSLKAGHLNRWLGIYNKQDWRCYNSVTANNFKNTDGTYNSRSFKFYAVKEVAAAPTEVTDALNDVNAYMSLAYTYNTTIEEVELPADKTVAFALGANGSASHYDGSEQTSYSATADGYTLNITGGTKMYTGARDAKGNSCIKLGTSSAVGGFKFTVPNDVTSVIIAVAKYKANTTKVTINGTTTTLTKSSDNGAYDEITIDTTSTKTISVTTVSGGVRAMVNTISYVIAGAGSGGTQEVTTYSDSQFRIKCAVDASIAKIAGITEYGIFVKADGKTVKYNSTAKSWTDNGELVYVVISLGDIINDKTKLGTEFTVQAYIVYNGETYYPDNDINAESVKTYSVASLVAEYEGLGYSVEHLYTYLKSLNLIKEGA